MTRGAMKMAKWFQTLFWPQGCEVVVLEFRSVHGILLPRAGDAVLDSMKGS